MLRTERKSRVRTRLRARSDRPRLSVFRSLKFIYAQIIDDQKGGTLAAARGKDPKDVGEKVAAAAKKKKIIKVVFDRGAYQYHSRVSKKTKGGNRLGFTVLMGVDDKKSRVGVGLGKAPDVPPAIKKGVRLP